jgi:diaminopimelate decarboxylase
VLDLFPASTQVARGELWLAGLTAAELVERFGTPLVVYCDETLRGQARALRAAVAEGGRVFYGTKAFPNVAVLRLLLEEGIGADVASAGELAFARAAGFSVFARCDLRPVSPPLAMCDRCRLRSGTNRSVPL